jgi:purine-nucleoside phosphorylase
VTEDPYALAGAAGGELRARLGGGHAAAIVLGSGWLAAAETLGTPLGSVPTSELPGFVSPTVAGHHGEARSIEVAGKRILVLLGRLHLYEGRSEAEVVHAVRAAVLSGVPIVVLTNASGGLDPALIPGAPVLIRDQINLTGRSPLAGAPPPEGYASRFVDLTDLYSLRLRELARRAEPSLTEGVYAGLVGPHYETPSEVAMIRSFGATLVGMSTTLEAIAAHHLGAEVLGIALVTNHAAGVSGEVLSHAEVLEAGAKAAPGLGRLIAAIVAEL